jgi:hypothetical protein
MYDSVRRSGKLGGTDMFNLAGRFDKRRFQSMLLQRRSRCRLRLMAPLELLTIVEADTRGSFDLDQGGVNEDQVP